MDNTLDSIKPIENRTMNSNLSFIYGRDPSILAYGQQPFTGTHTKKDLDSLYEDEVQECRSDCSSVPSISGFGDTIKVYLRLRPFPHKMKLSQEQQDAYKIISADTLLTKLPGVDNNSSRLNRYETSATVSRKFTFTNTFGPETTQLQLFEQAVKQQMNEFLNGQSATVMSYGTTNAGKSYTLQGTTVSPGIIPRGLEFVFCNINPRATPCYKPLYNTNVVSLDASARAYEMELKTKLLSFGSTDKNQYIQAYRSMQQLLQDESPLKPSETSDANYSVWVSFAEIYNETIYDLLSNDCQKKRPSLKLATDNNGKAFIKDLKMVCVNSGSEAYQLLMAGQYNLKVAATALNARSSRSHCIFTIKLLKYFKENSPDDVEVSTFSFCDLAGSERLKKTLNAGDRLKEAQNINTSLLVLGRCLKSIFDVQSAKLKHQVIGPFRESKLTRLFQSALSGKEHIALIVNVNPVPNLYIETQNVLNFSAIAKQIVIERAPRKKRATNSRFSQMVLQSLTTVTDWDATHLESNGDELSCVSTERAEYIPIEDYDEVVQENVQLKKEIAQLKSSALNSDFEIRQEMSDIYAEMIKNLESNFKNRLQDVEEQQADMLEWSVKQVEDFYKEKLSLLSSRKRNRLDNCDESETDLNIEELEAQNVQLMAKVESLKKSVKELRESKEELCVKNNQNAFELSLAKKDLQNYRDLLDAAQNNIGCGEEAEKVMEEMKKQLLAREEQIKSLKECLNEAKEDYVRSTDVERELEESLKTKDDQILKLSEKIADLIEQLEQANLCLAESTKTVETLEAKLLDVDIQRMSKLEKEDAEAALAAVLADLEEKVTTFKNELKIYEEEKINLQKQLDEKCGKISSLEIELQTSMTKEKDKENEILSLQKELKSIIHTSTADLEEKVATFEKTLKICEEEKTNFQKQLDEKCEKILSLDNELQASKTREKDKENEAISLQKELKGIIQSSTADLEEKIATFEKTLKICEEEKTKFQQQLDEKCEKILSLENELQESRTREKEKENETISLQKEVKSIIQMNTSETRRDDEMEKEVKKTLRELTATQQMLADTKAAFKIRERASEEKILRLEMRVKTFEENASYLAMLQDGAEKRQAESEQLRNLNNELRREIEQKNQELVSFIKNRDDTMQRYEALVRQLQEDMERSKREVSRYQELFLRQSTPTPRKEEIRKLKDELRSKTSLLEQVQAKLKKFESMREEKENINTSEDENAGSGTRQTRRRGKNNAPSCASNDISVIELSGSETKRVTRRTALPPPSTVPSVEKRKPRKKKLFAPVEETCVDVEPTETTPRSVLRSPLSSTRSLRNRRK